jgi:hypothetical protein
MALVDNYQVSAYNNLPNLMDAYDTFVERNPLEVIEHEISLVEPSFPGYGRLNYTELLLILVVFSRALFFKHNVYEELSVSLIHRHFAMKGDERLVEFGSVSTPWPGSKTGSVMAAGHIMPRSWRFVNGKLMPYEFGFNESSRDIVYKDLPNKPEFYADFGSLLEKHKLTDLLGLQLNTDMVDEASVKFEKTFDRANVIFTVPRQGELAQKEAISAQWVYKPLGDMTVPVKKSVVP